MLTLFRDNQFHCYQWLWTQFATLTVKVMAGPTSHLPESESHRSHIHPPNRQAHVVLTLVEAGLGMIIYIPARSGPILRLFAGATTISC